MHLPINPILYTGINDRKELFAMKSYNARSFNYTCNCGFTMKVFVDFGVPQETARCRKCSRSIQRQDQ